MAAKARPLGPLTPETKGAKTVNNGEISSINITAWLAPGFLRMKKKGLPSGCPFLFL